MSCCSRSRARKRHLARRASRGACATFEDADREERLAAKLAGRNAELPQTQTTLAAIRGEHGRLTTLVADLTRERSKLWPVSRRRAVPRQARGERCPERCCEFRFQAARTWQRVWTGQSSDRERRRSLASSGAVVSRAVATAEFVSCRRSAMSERCRRRARPIDFGWRRRSSYSARKNGGRGPKSARRDGAQ